ncbi:MAG: glutathione S-transferase N-terminal domain-containing protein [Methylobacterium sp.]|jgi:GST-like protein|uniref:glutathione S-transferase family protein n=1 Tax=Methylobacterium sp. TaxID=409 RepID=UPI00258EC957|nr:glutathione S-transferase N-terminal domain-containing protein [Methylobacterium sp.]MBY0295371.1 glutathione S-transferase N-terminal domain-containing protein [Methylobacterium sp.]
MTPIQLHTYATPNGHKASIMLEETGLPYEVRLVDIERGDQHRPDFLALNPANKIPVIVDPDRGRTLVESGAILFYLAERSGVLLPGTAEARDTALQWVLFQAAHVGPTLGQIWTWKIFSPEKPPAVIARFEREAERLFRVLDGQLARAAHLAGEAYGIADVMTWPWIRIAGPTLGLDLAPYPHLRRWHAAVAARPAVQRGLAVPAGARP